MVSLLFSVLKRYEVFSLKTFFTFFIFFWPWHLLYVQLHQCRITVLLKWFKTPVFGNTLFYWSVIPWDIIERTTVQYVMWYSQGKLTDTVYLLCWVFPWKICSTQTPVKMYWSFINYWTFFSLYILDCMFACREMSHFYTLGCELTKILQGYSTLAIHWKCTNSVIPKPRVLVPQGVLLQLPGNTCNDCGVARIHIFTATYCMYIHIFVFRREINTEIALQIDERPPHIQPTKSVVPHMLDQECVKTSEQINKAGSNG